MFEDVAAAGLAAALEAGKLHAIRSAPIDRELLDVLARPLIAARCAPQVLGDRLDRWHATTDILLVQGDAPWRCRDAQDQKFLDLAYIAKAQYLFTKDRALLELDRQSRRTGLQILEPRNFPGP